MIQASLMRAEDLADMRWRVTDLKIKDVRDECLEAFYDRFSDVRTAVEAIQSVAAGKTYVPS